MRTEEIIRRHPDLQQAWLACGTLLEVLDGFRGASEPGTTTGQLCCLLTALYQTGDKIPKGRSAIDAVYVGLAGEARDFGGGVVASSAAKCLSETAGRVQATLRGVAVEYCYSAAVWEFRQTDASGWLDFARGVHAVLLRRPFPGTPPELTSPITAFCERLSSSEDFARYASVAKPELAARHISALTAYSDENMRGYLEAEFLRAVRDRESRAVQPPASAADPPAARDKYRVSRKTLRRCFLVDGRPVSQKTFLRRCAPGGEFRQIIHSDWHSPKGLKKGDSLDIDRDKLRELFPAEYDRLAGLTKGWQPEGQ